MIKTAKNYILLLVYLISILAVHADNGRIYTVADKMSSSMITCITQDSYGYIWIGTEYGLNKFDGYHFTNYYSDVNDSTTISDSEITAFLNDREGRLWIGCRKGLSRYDYENNCFMRYKFPYDRELRIESIIQTDNGDILLGSAGYGFYGIKAGTDSIVKLSEFTRSDTDEFTKDIFEDDKHCLWRSSHIPIVSRIKVSGLKPTSFKDYKSDCGPVVSYIPTGKQGFILVCMYGILRYDYATGVLADAGYDLSALDKRVSMQHACLDYLGNLYVGTSGCGVMMIPKGSNTLVQIADTDMDFDLSSANVNQIFEDKSHNLWVGCYKKGLYKISRDRRAFSSWSFARQQIRQGSSVSSIASDGDGGVWCTVQKSGVYHFDREGRMLGKVNSPDGANTIFRDHNGAYWLGTENGLYTYNPVAGTSEKRLALTGWGVNCIAEDGEGKLFVSDYGKGLVIYETAKGSTRIVSMFDKDFGKGRLCNDWVKSLYYDNSGILWIGCSDGLSCLNPENGDFNVFGKKKMLEGCQCFSITEAKNGDMLIGTNVGMYLFDRKRNELSLFPHSEALQNKFVYAIAQESNGDLWLSTANSIWQYDSKDGKFVAHIGGNGLERNEYTPGAVIYSQDGRIIFGTNDGMAAFYPKDVRKSDVRLGDVYLTNFIINGKSANCMAENYDIAYNDNTFTMEFSLLDFRDVENVNFEYRINGTGEWVSTQEGDNSISFTKMPSGTYTIEVRAHKGGCYSNTRTIKVVVAAPWYLSTPAYFAYALLLLCLCVFFVRYYDRRRKEELEEAKMRFLINATHDIRSPLTLILGPLKKLKSRITDAENSADIDTIERNAQRLLVLVNQILDERRIDKNQLKLHCRETDMVDFIEGMCTLYRYNAVQRNITLTFDHTGKSLPVWIDRTNFDKVITNLLSNAFKYTYDGGSITFGLKCEGNDAVITLTDTGIGLSEENTERLFARFYQGKNSEDFHIEGTGIGLNLCKAIVTMHGGVIRAYNRTDGVKGACFELRLPMGTSHLKPEEIDTEMDEKTGTDNKKRAQANKNIRIMVVDDDPDIARYIARELGNWYKFSLFPNGKEALKALLTDKYDLVISDVVMPEMDGITLLRNIKGNSNISDVPVILLTTRSEVSDRLEGIKKGADAYVAKPFNIEELHVLVDNLVSNVRRLRGKFSGAQEQADKVEEITVKGNNDMLMDRIMEALNINLSDPDYNVERLTVDVGISRAQLHRKMKEMTGISTSDFIRNMRLEQAAKLIREGKINVTQVAYSVGFNNQSHFSTVFKKHFGMSPSEYAAKA